jgi:hypothetical protein
MLHAQTLKKSLLPRKKFTYHYLIFGIWPERLKGEYCTTLIFLKLLAVFV